MLVHIVADDPKQLSSVRSFLERDHHTVSSNLLCDAALKAENAEALVVRVDLRTTENIPALKNMLEGAQQTRKRIFLIESPAHVCVSQAYALGATLVLSGNLNAAKLLQALSQGRRAASGQTEVGRDSEAVTAAAGAIASLFTAMTSGMPVDLVGAKQSGTSLADHIAEHGLTDWLATVRRHHEGTYQHCLLVTGIAIDFGLSLGVGRADLERLHEAALFHDVGKAKIPLAILDKPGRLDAGERALIETHPTAGYEALRAQKGISAEILDAVRHHHEYLDGSGYPDQLSSGSIADIVRILTISDIFAALIEHRPYKPTMPRQEAYNILCGMNGKLERALVRAFKPVALDR